MVTRARVFFSLMLSSVLFIGIATAEDAEQVEEILVKGKYLSLDKINSVKTPTPIIDVPQSLSIFTADQIDQQGVKSIGDMINYTAGVNTSQGEGHRDSVVFRGVRSTADFFVDGVRDDVQYYRPLYNVEQVEILRGPNALLFGRGGTGGVLNRVMKKGIIGENFTGYKASVDTYGQFDVQIDSNFAVSETSAFRINAYYAGLDNHRDFYDGDRFGFNPTAHFELSPATTLDVSYEYNDHERFIDRGIPTGTNGEPVEAFEDILFADPELNKTKLEAHTFRATLEHKFLENVKGNLNVFYGDYDKMYQNFYASNYDQENTPDLVTTDGYVDTTKRENLILSGNLIGEFTTDGIEHTVIFGGEYIDTSSDQDRFNPFWDTTQDDNEIFNIARPLNLRGGVGVNSAGVTATNSFTTDLNDDTRVNIEVYSFYVQDQIEITPWLDVILGGRFDSFDIDVFNVVADEKRTRKDEEFSPRAGVIIKPRENMSIYGSYSESFLPRSGEQFANINGTNNQLDSDVFESWEVGVKWDITSALSFTAAYFQNEQTRADRDNVTGEQYEIRGLEIEGFELQVQAQITDRLHFSGGYSYLEGETASGAEPRELPENKVFFWGHYQLTDQFGIGLGVTHQDESLIKDGKDLTLPSYTRVDAAVYYDVSEDLRIQVNIENLTDELYFPNAHSAHQATVGAPLSALFSVSGRF
jgi:catecholate siderophore receptor